MIEKRIEIEALRSEVKYGFAYVNARLDSVDIQLTKQSKQIEELRGEMKAQGNELRGEMKAQADELRGEMKAQADELRGEMKAQADELRAFTYQTVNDAVDAIMLGLTSSFNELKTEICLLNEKLEKRGI